MRTTLAITLCLAVMSGCGEAERSPESAAAAPQAVPERARSRTVAELVVAEAELLGRSGMGFQRRWLHWHLAGRPSQDRFVDRTGGVAGYQAGGFDPARLSDSDRAALDEIRAAIADLPRGELRARYDALIARHGNTPLDASRTGSLRITDDGQYLVYADGDDAHGAHAWRIADGRQVGQVALRVSEDPFWTRDVLTSGRVWSQYTPTPAGRKLTLWDLPAGTQRSSTLIGDDMVLAVSSDGQRAAMISQRGVVIRGGSRWRPIATLRGVSAASLVRRLARKDDVIGDFEDVSVYGRAAFSGDGTLIALLAVDGEDVRLHRFRVAGGAPLPALAVSLGDLSHLEVDRTGHRVVGYAPGKNGFGVWDDGGERVLAAGARVDQVALSADGPLALLARGKRLELLDLATGATRWTVELSDPARLVALSAPAGLAAWWTDAELVVAALADGGPRPAFAGHRSWPTAEIHREALALATILEDPAPPMFEAGFRDPFREADALDAELEAAYLGSLPRAELALLPDLVEAHRGKPLRAGPAAAVVRAWRGGCDGWYDEPDPDYTPEALQPVDRRNLEAVHREIARRGAASPEATPAASGLAPGPSPCR
ncbi:MAG TPA: hypothetical protein VIG06_07395 [Kofleriaceae bacterium]